MEKPVQSPVYEGVITRVSAKRTSFWLNNITIDGVPTELGARNGELQILKRHWGDFGGLKEGDKVRFAIVDGNPCPVSQAANETTSRAAPQPVRFEPEACIGDDATLPPRRRQATVPPKEEQVIQLTFGGIFATVRDALTRGLKARASARS